MKNKFLYFPVILLVALMFQSCKEEIMVDFEYSPSVPLIGEKITFTNNSSSGDDFDWNFGNNTTSVAENPVRIYTVPGEYTVTLRVDSNSRYVRTKNITVYDSVPTIQRSVTQVKYFEEVTFSVLAYNPFGRKKTYEWYFSKNAVGESLEVVGDSLVSYEETPVVYFKKEGVKESVRLRMTVGDSIYTVKQIPSNSFTVEKKAARSLIMTRQNKKLLRQRIFTTGLEESVEMNIPSGKHPFNIIANGNYLYIFDAGSNLNTNNSWESDTSGDGSIRVVNLKNDSVSNIINNKGFSSYFGFYNGFVDNNYVYWTDRNEFVYRLARDSTDIQFEWKGNTQNELFYYLVRADSLGIGKDTYNGGIYFYDNIYFWAKGGAEKGIYRFTSKDIKQKQLSMQPILTEYAVRAFTIDRINAQLYFSSVNPVGIWVSNLDGTNVRLIDDAEIGDDESQYITGIIVDNYSGYLFWSYRAKNDNEGSGVKQMKLVNSFSNPDRDNITYFNKEKGIYGIALDHIERY